MGGALFIYEGNVTVSDTVFLNNQAIGGSGIRGSSAIAGGIGLNIPGSNGSNGSNGGNGSDGGNGGGNGGGGGRGGDGGFGGGFGGAGGSSSEQRRRCGDGWCGVYSQWVTSSCQC